MRRRALMTVADKLCMQGFEEMQGTCSTQKGGCVIVHECLMKVGSRLDPKDGIPMAIYQEILSAATVGRKSLSFREMASSPILAPRAGKDDLGSSEVPAMLADAAKALCPRLGKAKFSIPYGLLVEKDDPRFDGKKRALVFERISCVEAEPPQEGGIDFELTWEARQFLEDMDEQYYLSPYFPEDEYPDDDDEYDDDDF